MSKLKYFDGTDWKVVNGQITGDTLPIGSIIPFGGETAPAGWLLCWGQELSRASYPELYSVIGDAFGGDDGDLTFNLPDLRGRTIVGKNSTDTDFNEMGKTGGEKTHTLTISEMPSHNHTPNEGATTFATTTGGQNDAAQTSGYRTYEFLNISNTGGGQAHNNLQPYQVTNYIIKYKNTVGLVGNVLDNNSNSHTDSYSCDYINNAVLDKYSTTEQIIGTWIDGSTIYRKVVDLGTLVNANTKLVPSGITEQIYPIKVYGFAIKNAEMFPLPFIWGDTSAPNNYCGLFYDRGNNQFYFRTNRDMSTYNGIGIIEYTKDE